MTEIAKQFCTFIESECGRLNCPDMIPALKQGFHIICESSEQLDISDTGPFDMDYGAWEGDDFWKFTPGTSLGELRLTLNLPAWFKASGVAGLLSADEFAGILDGWRGENLRNDNFGTASISGWYSRPGQYDPGDGDCHCRIDTLPSEDELSGLLSNDIDFIQDTTCPDLGKPGVKEALMSSVPELASELATYIGYED